MPYIPKERRSSLDLSNLVSQAKTAGELNYRLTLECLDYLKGQGESYCIYNTIIGALECTKIEFYRRMIEPYEEVKKIQNGDVYD